MIDRYQDSAIDRIFSRDAQLDRWAKVETVAVEVRYGSDDGFRLSLIAPPGAREVLRAERAVKHEMVAFLNEWTRDMPADLASKVHHGLTSSDIIDTAFALQLRDAGDIVMERGRDFLEVLRRVSTHLLQTPQASRTHGQQATVSTGDRPWDVFTAMWVRQLKRLEDALQDAQVGKVSGPAGDYPVVDPSTEHEILAKLGLRSVESTQIVPRDFLASVARELAALLTLAEAIATDLRLWAISEVGEFREGTGSEYVGSSSIPHKVNPSNCERICGYARLGRPLAEALQLGVVQWWDRDLAHSSTERVAVPDLFHLTSTAIRDLERVLDFGVWDEERMTRNATGFTDTAAALNEMVGSGADRRGAHEELRNPGW